MKSFFRIAVPVAVAVAAGGGAAEAGLRICNDTAQPQMVAVGYLRDGGWVSLGWWKIEPQGCAVTVDGDLQNRYYYYRAEIDAGPFNGNPEFTFCTDPKVFEILGDDNCEARGYEAETFAEIDTGPSATDFTFRLTDSNGGVPPARGGGLVQGTPGVDTGLQFCNDTAHVQSLSIGLQRGNDWVSAGWWNLEPGECKLPVSGELQNRYYYYRAEVDGGPFNGDPDYAFCTSPKAFEILGDSNCEARGYERETFAEIDTGPEAVGYTFRLTEATGGVVTAQEGGSGAAAGAGGLELCNDTTRPQAVSIGFKRGEDWVSAGWWNLEPGECRTTVTGELENRYYYFRAESDGALFNGNPDYTFCTSPEAFEIVGDSNCEGRGYDTRTFAEIDTGASAKSHTFHITDAVATPAPPRSESGSGSGTAGSAGGEGEGLGFCNRTSEPQALAIAYSRDDEWVSMGWWMLSPGDCSLAVPGALTNQYYYYRAEGPGGGFRGDGYSFCTTTEAFEIVGDKDCEARGYETEDFREIDTGPTATSHMVVLDSSATGSGGGATLTPGKTGEPPTGFVFETQGGEGGSTDGRFRRKPPRR